jgi:hypothetical protein
MRILYCWEVGRVRNGGSPAMLETDFISQIGDVAELRLYSRTTVQTLLATSQFVASPDLRNM